MTSNRAKLQALIDKIDSAFSESTPEAKAQQQEAIAQIRQHLTELQRQGPSQEASAQQVLQAGDRVEIYRPLLADPKEVRKERAARAKERRAKEKS